MQSNPRNFEHINTTGHFLSEQFGSYFIQRYNSLATALISLKRSC